MEGLISIVVGFKNRELERVEQFIQSLQNQSYKHFELIFVDYGSDLILAEQVEAYLKNMDFCNYVYNDSRGKSWSRSHALNIGSKLSKGDYLYFTDIDLLFHPDYLNHLHGLKNKHNHTYTRVYYLEESFTEYSNLFKDTYFKLCEISHTSGKGILFIAKDLFHEIGGYDEYYCDWGIEDNDIYIRLISNGNEEKWTENENYPVYHAWHPPTDKQVEFPEKWLDDMSFYYTINQKNVLRNLNGYGKLIKKQNRKLISLLDKQQFSEVINVMPKGSTSTKTVFYRAIWKVLNEKQDGLIQVNIPKFQFNNLSFIQRSIYKFLNKIIRLTGSPYTLHYTEAFDRERFFFPERDIRWFLRKLEKETNVVSDYYLEYNQEIILVYIL